MGPNKFYNSLNITTLLLEEPCFDLTMFPLFKENNCKNTSYLTAYLYIYLWLCCPIDFPWKKTGPGEQQLRAMDCGDLHLSTISCYQDTIHRTIRWAKDGTYTHYIIQR